MDLELLKLSVPFLGLLLLCVWTAFGKGAGIDVLFASVSAGLLGATWTVFYLAESLDDE